MSVKYEILKRLVKAAGIKKIWLSKSTEELLENRRKQNAANRIPDLKDDDFQITRVRVMGHTVLKMIHKQPSERANLFLIGGGMISAPRPGSIKKALRFAKETGLDLYVPYYPLCTDYPLTKAYEMIHETYKLMLKDYAADHISVLGTSSGGNLALGMVPYINDGHRDVPMPSHIMAISPGTCVDTDEEWQRMLELDKKDVAIPAQYMKTAVEIMRHGDDSVPDYMIWLQRGDFTGCPRVTFIYGTDETLYACAPSFEAAMKRYGVDYRMITGQGMFHCYPVFPVCREAEEGWDMMVRLMKETDDTCETVNEGNRFWDLTAGVYDVFVNVINRKTHRELKKIVSGLISPGDDVLECACGTGMLSAVIAPRCRHLTATDLSRNMLEKARKNCTASDNITYAQADMTALPYQDRSFDKVIAGNVIHLLDEATASLDVENETKVQYALSRLLSGKTVLVIAHRMRTVEAADKIVVLSDGRVAEEGSPAELLSNKDSIFRHMMQLQGASAGWSI